MDPVSALGLATNVVQCVQFTSSLLRGTYNIYSQGFSDQSQELDRIYRRLSGFSSDLANRLAKKTASSSPETQSSKHAVPLKELATSCQGACDEIVAAVSQLKTKNGSQKRWWKSFKVALKEIMKQEVLLTLDSEQIEELQRLILQSQRLRCSHETDLQSIRTDVSQILQKLHHWQGQHSSDGPDSPDIGLLSTKLSELSLESQRISMAQEILATLDYAQRPVRHENISEAHARTFSWALQSHEPKGDMSSRRGQGDLSQWLSSGRGMFWVSGKPGSGKSTFMKYVADHPETRRVLSSWASPHGVIVASHYFWSVGTAIQRSQQGLWQSLLFEILSKIPDAIPEVCNDRWQLKLVHPAYVLSRHSWGTTELRSCFSRLAKQGSSGTRFCMFIDGLDEFDGDHLDMVQTLVEVSQSPMIKLCVSSRPWNVFEKSLGQSSMCKIYMHELTRDDILQFSKSQLARHPRWAVEVGSADADLLINDIANRAQGVFLWVFLVTRLLREGLTNDDTPSDLRRILDSIHPDLEQFFKQILDGVSGIYHEKMAGVLEMTLAAHEPLNASIYHFHEMEYDDIDFALKERICSYSGRDIDEIRSRRRSRLDAFCKGLLEVDAQQHVQYIHRTVKDWLGTPAMRSYLKEKVYPGFNADLSILRAYFAMYKHPLVGSEVKIKPENLIVNWSGWIVDTLVEAVPYTYMMDRPGPSYNTDEVDRILDGFYSVTSELFKQGLVKFAGQSQGLPEANCNLMLRSNLLFFGPWCYLAHKVRENPDYFTPVVRCPKSIRLRVRTVTDAMQGENGSIARCEVTTSVLKLFLDEYWPENIADHDGGSLSHGVCDRMATLEFLTIPVCLIGQGADPGVTVRTTAGGSQIPAWLAFVLLAFKLRLSSPEMGSPFLECLGLLLDDIDANVVAANPQTGCTPWEILCSHINALREGPKTHGSVSRDTSVTEDSSTQQETAGPAGIRLKFLSSVVRALVDRLVSCPNGNILPWRDLLAAIGQGFPRHISKPFSKKLRRPGLVPEGWEPDAAGPAVLRPSASRKRNPAELSACEPGAKRARRCSV